MNLHCPARLILLPAADAARLDDRRVARIYTSAAAEAEAAGLAGRLGVGVEVVPELDDGSLDLALQGIADLHRGETVVVLGVRRPGGAPDGEVVEVDHDGAGWTVVPRG